MIEGKAKEGTPMSIEDAKHLFDKFKVLLLSRLHVQALTAFQNSYFVSDSVQIQ